MSSCNYKPMDSGQPCYFAPMLRDDGRLEAYRKAILKLVPHVRTLTNAPLRAVDFGAGTGLLSKILLEAGVDHVTLVDVNRDMLQMAKAALEYHGYVVDEHFSLFHGSLAPMGSGVDVWKGEPFDMLVSEILGTLTTSESQHVYLPQALKHVKHFDGFGQFCIPQKATQCLSLYELSIAAEDNACIRYPHDNVLPQWTKELAFVPTDELRMYDLHLREKKKIKECYVRMDIFGGIGGHYHEVYNPSFPVPPDLDWNHFFVLEWECVLFDDVVLKNTLQGYRECPASAVARHTAWGFFIANACDLADLGVETAEFTVSYPSNKKGWPTIAVATKRKRAS